MKIRALAQHREGHSGFFRAGRFWSSSEWTEADVDEGTLAVLQADPRLMVEDAKPTAKAAPETKVKG